MKKDIKNDLKNQGLFKLAETSKVTRNPIWFVVFATIIMFLGEIIVAGIQPLFAFNPTVSFVIGQLVLGFGVSSLLIFLIVRFREKRSIRSLGFIKNKGLKHWFLGFGLGTLAMLVAALIIWILGGYEYVPNSFSLGINFLPTILFTIIGWTVQGGTEEIITRGWMMPLLGRRYNVPFSIIFTALYFFGLHLLNDGMSFIPSLNLFLFGVFAGIFVVYTKNIWSICGFHTAWNWAQGNVLGVLVSGMKPQGGSLIELKAKGAPIISGGAFGVEGSLIATIMFVLAIIVLVCIIKKEHANEDVVSIK